MTREYHPDSLGVVVEGPYAKKRLKNRSGFARCAIHGELASGNMLLVLAALTLHEIANPGCLLHLSCDTRRHEGFGQ